MVQLADPDIIDWIMGQAGAAAEADGRATRRRSQPIVCAPVVVGDDIAAARDAVRWFPAMVSNHVVDLLKRYDQSMLPASLTGYLERREFYDYAEHSRRAPGTASSSTTRPATGSASSAPSRITSRSCATLEAHGVKQFNIYLMTGGQEETLRMYGEHIIPLFKSKV